MAKVVLVTGASAGIGKATALELLGAGHIVYGAARRVHQMDDIRAAGGHVLPHRRSGQQRRDRPARRGRGHPAGSGARPVRGECLRSGPLGCWYYATKHALEAYSDSLRMEVEPFGIDVVIVQPGIIKTEFEDHTARDLRAISGPTAYGAMAEAMATSAEAQLGENSQGSDPGVVATTIRRAVEADKPETRYAVGWMADKLLELNRTLPDREFDQLVIGAAR